MLCEGFAQCAQTALWCTFWCWLVGWSLAAVLAAAVLVGAVLLPWPRRRTSFWFLWCLKPGVAFFSKRSAFFFALRPMSAQPCTQAGAKTQR